VADETFEPLDATESQLRDALDAEVPVRGGPDPARIAALRAEAQSRQRPPSHRPAPARRNYALVAAAVVAAFVGGALLLADPPGPVRDLASTIGLDVDSSDYVTAQERVDDLGRALAVATDSRVAGTLTADQMAAVADADADMLAAIGRLDDGERADLVPLAHQVHLRAVELFVAEGVDLATAKPSDLAEIERAG
jgi:hypothetical protein